MIAMKKKEGDKNSKKEECFLAITKNKQKHSNKHLGFIYSSLMLENSNSIAVRDMTFLKQIEPIVLEILKQANKIA